MRVATKHLLCTIAIIAIASSCAIGADVAERYTATARSFDVCALSVSGTGVNAHPMIFEALRRFPDKPAGWEFNNPLAPPQVANGLVITKADPEYWTVPLTSQNAARLVGMDLLYISQAGLNLTATAHRDALIKAVRNGAVLWVDQAHIGSGGSGTSVSAFAPPGPDNYVSGETPPPFTFGDSGGGNIRSAWDNNHWLLQYPFRIDHQELQYLGRLHDDTGGRLLEAISFDPSVAEYFSGVLSDDTDGDGVGDTISAAVAPLGAGAIVVTAGEIGYALEEWANLFDPSHPAFPTTGHWWSADRLRYPSHRHLPDFKFACNLLAAAGDWSQARQNAYAAAKSPSEVKPPLQIDWQFPDRFESADFNRIGPVVGNPVYSGGMVFVMSLPKQTGDSGGEAPAYLMCFDADPAQDLDGDGRADDGVLDYSAGTSYDLVWRVSLGNMTPRYSSPTVATIPSLADGRPLQVVLVSLVDPAGGNAGQLRCYNATIDPATLDYVADATGLPAPYYTPGDHIWSYGIDAYDAGGSANAEVVALSTPVVSGNYAYVLATEFDDDVDGDSGTTSVDDTYGRAHAVQIDHRWDADANGGTWQMPDPTADPANDGNDDPSLPEPAGLFPPFHNPQWVAGLAPYNADPDSSAARPMLPPARGCVPVVDSLTDVPGSTDYDAVLRMAAPVRTELSWDAGNSRWVSQIVGWDDSNDPPTHGGGIDISVVPTPTSPDPGGGTPVDELNEGYFSSIVLSQADPADPDDDGVPDYTRVTAIERVDNPAIDLDSYQVTTDGSTVRIQFTSAQARELLLPADDGTGPSPVECLSYYGTGVQIRVQYDVDGDQDGDYDNDPPGSDLLDVEETQTLRGPIRSRSNAGANLQRSTSASISGPDSTIAATDISENAAREIMDLPPGRAAIYGLSRERGARQWNFAPESTLPTANFYDDVNDRYQPSVKSTPAVDRATDTAFVVLNNINENIDDSDGRDDESLAEVIGLGTKPKLTVHLRPSDGSGNYIPGARVMEDSVEIISYASRRDPNAADDVIGSDTYAVDTHNHCITFDPTRAHWENGDALYGRAVWISYEFVEPGDPTNRTARTELHIIPDITRCQYMPGFIRLNHNFVHFDPNDPTYSPRITLPNARNESDCTPVTNYRVGEIPLDGGTYDLPDNLPGGTSWAAALPRGILDVRDLRLDLANSNLPLQPGTAIQVSYYYFDEATGKTKFAREQYQVPRNIGESVSDPALGGTVLHLGVDGYDPNHDYALDQPETDPGVGAKPFLVGDSVRETLFSILWDPVTNRLRGHAVQPAIPETASYAGHGIPSVSSGLALGHNRVFVGSKMATQIPAVGNGGGVSAYLNEGIGFVSGMESDSTIICDDTRIIEVIDQEPVWSCHGTVSAMVGETVDSDRGADDRMPLPFNRPAKAEKLPNGNILVVDTGNDRVVEIDKDGVLQWPLTRNGYDYYSARGQTPNDNPLNLDSPSDAFRYYTVEYPAGSGTYYNSTNGNLLPNTQMHTVIADPGNGRLLDVVTYLDGNGDQNHEVRVLTPSHVKLTSGASSMQKIAYSAVEPVFDPVNTAVIGYLCAAANLHQLMVVERGTQRINPPSDATPPNGTADSNWKWLAWLWDADIDDTTYGPSDSLIFRNIRDMDLSYEGNFAYLTVTCGQYAGRLSDIQDGRPHAISKQGDGVFEFCMNLSGGAGSWALESATDDGGAAEPDTPIWYMTRRDYLYSYPASDTRRQLTNIRYQDADGNNYWQNLPWFPVAAARLPSDSRPADWNGDGTTERYFNHMVVNHAGLIMNLTRRNVPDNSAPALLGSSVLTVQTEDANDNYPGNDTLDIDRRLVIPDPARRDWTDPLAQPTDASR